MNIIPINFKIAKEFIDDNHRHVKGPRGWKFGVGLENDNELIGVGIASRPVARNLDNGITLEITRVCTLGDKNANSMIYGALIRAGRALGYKLFYTYTLKKELGSSVKAVGFLEDAKIRGGEWDRPSRSRQLSIDVGYDTAEKIRWILDFNE